MTKLPFALLLLILIKVFTFTSTHADSPVNNSANITALAMKQGDNSEWRQPGFNSETWPFSRVNGAGFNRVLTPDTIAWLRTPAFALPQNIKDQPIALHVVTGATFEVFWNGKLIGRNGQPGINLQSETNGLTDSRHYIPPEFMLAEGNVLAVRYSAHGYQRLHLPLAFSFRLGPYENEKYQRLASYVPAFLLIGGVGAAAIFFAALFARRRSDKGSLWLALFIPDGCTAVGFRDLTCISLIFILWPGKPHRHDISGSLWFRVVS